MFWYFHDRSGCAILCVQETLKLICTRIPGIETSCWSLGRVAECHGSRRYIRVKKVAIGQKHHKIYISLILVIQDIFGFPSASRFYFGLLWIVDSILWIVDFILWIVDTIQYTFKDSLTPSLYHISKTSPQASTCP